MRWHESIRDYRRRHGLSQTQLADMVGVAQRTVSRWERGEAAPGAHIQRRLRDLGWRPSPELLRWLRASVLHCPSPRALSRMPRLTLLALSQPAIAKRPSVVAWIGRDLAPIADGILAEMLADRALQAGIARGEIAAVTAVTRSVLKTDEAVTIGTWRTSITYFQHDGAIYSDAQSVCAGPHDKLGYTMVAMDDLERSFAPP
jgi:DNA-binding XRE family transcriptional regulator